MIQRFVTTDPLLLRLRKHVSLTQEEIEAALTAAFPPACICERCQPWRYESEAQEART